MLFETVALALALEMGCMPIDQMEVTGTHRVDVQYYSESQDRWYIANEMSFRRAETNVDNAMYLTLNPSVNYKGFDIQSNITPRVVYINSNVEFVDFTGEVNLEYSWKRYSIGSEFQYTLAPEEIKGFTRINHKQLKAYVRIEFATEYEGKY